MSENLTRYFTHLTIPSEIWLRKDISIYSKALWAEMRSLHDKEKGGCYASDEYLMEFLGLKRSRLHELFKQLKDVGLMEVVSFNGRQTVRRAIVPDVEYESGQQLSGKPDTSNPENRTPPIRKTGFTPYIENKAKNKVDIEEQAPPPYHSKSTLHKKRKVPTSPISTIRYGEFVVLKEGEYEKLCESMSKELVNYYINSINNWVPNNKTYKDYAAAIRQWCLSDKSKGKIPSSQNIKSNLALASTEDDITRNRKICNFIEDKLRNNFNERVFFQAGPSSALLVNTNKDFKKEFHYEKFTTDQLKQLLPNELEILFPGSRNLFTVNKTDQMKVKNLVANLADQYKM